MNTAIAKVHVTTDREKFTSCPEFQGLAPEVQDRALEMWEKAKGMEVMICLPPVKPIHLRFRCSGPDALLWRTVEAAAWNESYEPGEVSCFCIHMLDMD